MKVSSLRSPLTKFVIASVLAASPRGLNAQATTGFPNNPFPGTGNPFTLTWGADDGAACTQVGGPIDNGNTNAEIKGITCAAAKFDYYSNGWAQLSIWNRSGAEAGSSSSSTLRSFGLFWCRGVNPNPLACPTGADPLVGGTPPITYNDGTLAGNWYPGGNSGNDPIDWRLISPTGQILVPPNSPNYPITAVAANGIGGTKGDGFVDNGFSALPSTTPFTSLNGGGAYVFQFFMGTGSAYDFTNQWVVLDAKFSDVPKPGGGTFDNADFSCVDDRYQGTPVAGTQDSHVTNNVGCGGVAAGTGQSVVPEPASLMLLGTGLIGLAPLARRRRRVK